MIALFTMADVESAFADFADPAVVAQRRERRQELNQTKSKSVQARNAAALQVGNSKEVLNKSRQKIKKRQQRQLSESAGLGRSGQRRGYFRTVKGKKTFVKGGAVMSRVNKSGKVVKSVIDRGSGGLRGALRDTYQSGLKMAGRNSLGQKAVNTSYRAASHVLARPIRYGGGAVALAGGGAYLVSRRKDRD